MALTVCDVTLRDQRPNRPEQTAPTGGADLQRNEADRRNRKQQSQSHLCVVTSLLASVPFWK